MARAPVPVAGLVAAGGFAAAAVGYACCRKTRGDEDDDDEPTSSGFASKDRGFTAPPPPPAAGDVPEPVADVPKREPVELEAAPPGFGAVDAVQLQQQQQQQEDGQAKSNTLPLSMALEIAAQMSPEAITEAVRRMAQIPPEAIGVEELRLAIAIYTRVNDLNSQGHETSALIPHQLIRVFGSFQNWKIPMSEEGDLFGIPHGGGVMLSLCSDDDAVAAVQKVSPHPLKTETLPGWDAFVLAAGSQSEGVNALVLDVNLTQRSVILPQHVLLVWGASLRLENHLALYEMAVEEAGKPLPLDPGFGKELAAHPALHVIEAEGGFRGRDGAILVLTSPDQIGWAVLQKAGKCRVVGPATLLQFAAEGNAISVFRGADLSSGGFGHFETVKILSGDLARGIAPYIQEVEAARGVPSLAPETEGSPKAVQEATPAPEQQHRPALPSSDSLD
eukprot:Hpha_TRINITY_DN16141_c4_g1::TRINITY_DN16141_c4_g1_i1::g.6033::m.6033